MEWMCPSGRSQPGHLPTLGVDWVEGPSPRASDVRHPVSLTPRGYLPLFTLKSSSPAPRPLVPVVVGAVGGTICSSRAGRVDRTRPIPCPRGRAAERGPDTASWTSPCPGFPGNILCPPNRSLCRAGEGTGQERGCARTGKGASGLPLTHPQLWRDSDLNPVPGVSLSQ